MLQCSPRISACTRASSNLGSLMRTRELKLVGSLFASFFIVSLAGFVLSRKAASDLVLRQLSELIPVYKDELRASLAEIIRRRSLSGLLGTAVLLLFAIPE